MRFVKTGKTKKLLLLAIGIILGLFAGATLLWFITAIR
jgi:uncharacterized protein involved in exopolysaccharide biosynthesis